MYTAVTINYLAVLGAAVAAMVIGGIWYAPPIFGNIWMKELGKKKEDLKGQGPALAMAAVGALLMAYVLAHFVQYTGSTTAVLGAETGFWIWLGFVATVEWANKIFQNQSWTLFAVTVFHHLVVLAAMGAILAVWH